MSPGGAVVTGAGGGLGREVALRLAKAGYAVHVTDVDEQAARAVAAEVGGEASLLDVRDQRACRETAAAVVAEVGSLDLWVNNAGVLITAPAWEHTDEQRRLRRWPTWCCAWSTGHDPASRLPRWRDAQVRLFDLTPGFAMRVAPLVVRLSRAQQRSAARKIRRAAGLPD